MATPRRANRSLDAPAEDRPDGAVGTGDDVAAGSRACRPPSPARGRRRFPWVPRGASRRGPAPTTSRVRARGPGPGRRPQELRGSWEPCWRPRRWRPPGRSVDTGPRRHL